jgi:hypothetical protein
MCEPSIKMFALMIWNSIVSIQPRIIARINPEGKTGKVYSVIIYPTSYALRNKNLKTQRGSNKTTVKVKDT